MSLFHPYIRGDTPEIRRERQNLYALWDKQTAADKAQAEKLEAKAKKLELENLQARWLQEETATKKENAEADKLKWERHDEMLAQMQRLNHAPEEETYHRMRLAESDDQCLAQNKARFHQFHASHAWPGY